MKELKAMQVAMDQFNEVIDSVVTTKARTTDPWTSHAAAKSLSAKKLSKQHARILMVLKTNSFPLAAEQIDDRLGFPAFRRMSELKRQGLIEDSGEIYIGRSGRKAIKYIITTKGNKLHGER